MFRDNYRYGYPFKFKSLKTYTSKEYMAENTRKYRTVFDKSEISYLRWELCFFNKLFDEEDWTTKVAIKVFAIVHERRQGICNLENEINVAKTENKIFVNESWGSKIKGSWEKGTYEVEAYIAGRLVGSEKFYVEDVGVVTASHNPYFEVESLRLYAGDNVASQQKNKKYLNVFNKAKTQYVWVELKIKNKVPAPWHIEIFFNFYDDAGQLKTKVNKSYLIEDDEKNSIFVFELGWGHEDEGITWLDDKYRLDFVFMDTLIESVFFEMGEEEVEGEVQIKDTSETRQKSRSTTHHKSSVPSLNVLMRDLDELIGLEGIKTQIKEHVSYLEFLKLRKRRGVKEDEKIALHSVFTGNPGTGKTTVVKLLGKIYYRMGLLSKGHIHEVDRADLIGKYIGQTAPQVREHIEKARGGVLFIDEAYALARSKDDSMDYGLEAIEILIKEMSDGEGDLAIMVAGYPQEMQTFMNINPGLKSRFQYHFAFDDYTPDELLKIARYAAEKGSVTLDEAAENQLYKLLLNAYRDRDRTFGNARYACSLIDEAKFNLGIRLIKRPDFQNLSTETLSLITLEDVTGIKSAATNKDTVNMPIDEDLLKLALDDLNKLVGMENVKNSINEMVKLTRYYKETGKNVLDNMAKHTIFMGNPGTGKTTVARIISKIYKALGLLERGHLEEVSREDLIAGYTGQTAIKTKEKINDALGGVLFIDEAYALFEGGEDSYGKEAIEVLLKMMEDKRGQFVVIAAGYPDNMDAFLKSNPGLKSRFDKTLHFYDYQPDALYQIAVSMFRSNDLEMNADVSEFLKSYIQECYKDRDKYFGNARFIRKIVQETVKKQNLRMASMRKEERTADMMSHIIWEDIKDIKDLDRAFKPTRKLGFIR